MESLLDITGGVLLVAGAVFLLLGGLGLWRMPDLFNRIQAGAKTTTLGTILILAGAAFLHPEWGFKLLLIGIFLLFTNPLSSQVLARAAHRRNIETSPQTSVDMLADAFSQKATSENDLSEKAGSDKNAEEKS
ncbi:MAG: monovalent cation/H(+) antiporter subunit G [Gammaproteobacteria bacterium]|nr:monovalent cation/H(+) antiporter subunit G [Gammaproteobacteria bacterium]